MPNNPLSGTLANLGVDGTDGVVIYNNGYGSYKPINAITGKPATGASSGVVSSGATYTVKSGDTFAKIAARYGLTTAQLKALNPRLVNINNISVGQKINVSGSGNTVSATGSGNAGAVTVPVVTTRPSGEITVAPIVAPVVPVKNSPLTDLSQKWGVPIGVILGVGILATVVIIKRK